MPVKLGDKYFLNEKVQSNEEKFEIIFSYLLSCYNIYYIYYYNTLFSARVNVQYYKFKLLFTKLLLLTLYYYNMSPLTMLRFT